MTDPRYPIGKFERRDELTPDERRARIDEIAAAPAALREAVKGLSAAQLDTPYREGGWSLRQVVHHLPDSHVNAYCRTKLALAEDNPSIRPYDEDAWARLSDSRDTPVDVSVTLLEALHVRWTTLLRALRPEEFARTFKHPEHGGTQTLDWLVALYAWHGRHHVAHITSTRERMGWA